MQTIPLDYVLKRLDKGQSEELFLEKLEYFKIGSDEIGDEYFFNRTIDPNYSEEFHKEIECLRSLKDSN